MSQAQLEVTGKRDRSRSAASSIFIVEDELVVAKDIEKTLVKLGYRVLGRARCGTAAVLQIGKLRPDLVLMDIGLPGGVDGVATAAAIRDKIAVPVVFLSGLGDSETRNRAAGSDPFGYVVKPFMPAELRGAIEIALRRSRSEAAARTRERLLLTTLRAVGDGLVTTNERGEVDFMNPVAEQMTGWASKDAVGRNLDEVLQLRGEHTGEPVTSPRQALEERCLTRTPKGTLLIGRTLTVAIDGSSAPIFDEAAAPLGLVVVFRDASEQQRLEGQLRGCEKMEVVGELTSAIAHDFNNVLSAILLCSRFLITSFEKDDPRRQDAEEIERSSNRGAALTRQLLMFGKRKALEPTPLSLNEVVTELEHILRLLSGNVELGFDGAPDLGLVTIDRGQVEQVLVNLVVNARDSMPNGGTLQIETSNVMLTDASVARSMTLRPGGHVLLSVTDSGCGMDAETQLRIFEPFFSTKEQGKGTGLGLSSSYEIVKQNGGEIEVASKLGHGSTFTVCLPRSEGRSASYTRELSARGGSREPETILLVEKDTAVREAVARTLESCGYRVLRSGNQSEASGQLSRYDGAIDLLLSDVIPSSAADQLPSQLETRCADSPLLFMSGYGNGLELQSQSGKVRSHVIRKPFRSDALARKVRVLLDTKSGSRARS